MRDGRLALFADAELRENAAEDFIRGNRAGDLAEKVEAIARAVITDKGYPIDEGALSGAVADIAVTALRRLCKRETVTKSGTSRNAQWALAPSLL